MDIDDLPEGEELSSDVQIVRWATDPTGRVNQISAEVPDPPDWPMFKPDADAGRLDRLLLWRANRWLRKGYERGERRHSGPPIWYLEVWRYDVDGETLLVDEEVTGAHQAQIRVDELVSQVSAGIVQETE